MHRLASWAGSRLCGHPAQDVPEGPQHFWLEVCDSRGVKEILVKKKPHVKQRQDWAQKAARGSVSRRTVVWEACVLSRSSSLTLCDPTACSLPGSFVCGISQARILKWVAISFSRWDACVILFDSV